MKKWNCLDRKLILASGSPRRKELLAEMNLPFEVIVDAIEDEERFFRELPVEQAIAELARAKGHGVALKNPDSLVIGADTVVVHRGAVLGKPKDRDDAFRMLQGYSGMKHQVLTCVSLECAACGFHESVTVTTDVLFRVIEEWEINEYLDTAHYQDKAGAYGIQDDAKLFVESIHGCYFNVVGFPVTAVIDLLKKYHQWNERILG